MNLTGPISICTGFPLQNNSANRKVGIFRNSTANTIIQEGVAGEKIMPN